MHGASVDSMGKQEVCVSVGVSVNIMSMRNVGVHCTGMYGMGLPDMGMHKTGLFSNSLEKCLFASFKKLLFLLFVGELFDVNSKMFAE